MSLRLRIGLSGKNDKDGRLYEPLSDKTPSGKIVKKLQDSIPGVTHRNVNLVSYAPLDNQWCLRYPTPEECNIGRNELLTQLQTLKPDVIIALGKQVQESLGGLSKEYKIVEIPHPSYISRRQKALRPEVMIKLTNTQ